MHCDNCKKNEATVHLTKIEGGKMLKVDLCEACSKAKGIEEGAGFSPADFFGELGLAASIKADFKKTGRLGCSACWETFEEGLASLLKAMHKSDRHVGKVPGKAAHTIVISERIKELARDLEKAVSAEKYEEAAQIRDQIRDLESKLKTTGSVA
jgi:protein arginine kinase activator